MATWTAVDGDSWFGTSWVADMGVYIGPETGIRVDYLPPDCDELDFYVGHFTGDLETGQFQGRYAAPYRYRGSGGIESAQGSGTFGDVTNGAHLIAIWYGPGYPRDPALLVPPSVKPEQVVPCIYVRGGRGPYFGPPSVVTPGHWSEWIDGAVAQGSFLTNRKYTCQGAWDRNGGGFFYYDIDPAYPYGSGYVNGSTGFPPSGRAAFPSCMTELNAKLANVRADIRPITENVPPYFARDFRMFRGEPGHEGGISIFALKNVLTYYDDAGPMLQEYAALMRFSQSVTSVEVRQDVLDPDPDYFAYFNAHGLSQGADWDYSPDTGQAFQLESAECTFLGWNDLTLHPRNIASRMLTFEFPTTSENGGGDHPGTNTTEPVAMPVVFKLLNTKVYDPPTNGAQQIDPVPTYGPDDYGDVTITGWSSLGDDAVAVIGPDEGTEVARWTPSAEGETGTVTIPLSTLGATPQFTLTAGPALYYEGHVSDWISEPIDYGSPSFTSRHDLDFRYTVPGIDDGQFSVPRPVVRYQQPRWRYWIPEVSTPGALRCCPGQTLRITPRAEGHWSDWQDGLTVTRGNGSGFAARANNRSSSWAAWDGNVEFPPLAGDQASFDTFLARLIAGGQSPLSQFSLSGYVGLASWAWSQVRQQRAGLNDAHYVQNMYVTVGGVNLQLDPAAASFPFAGVSTPTPGGAGAPPGPLVNDGIQWESGTATAHLADLTLTDRKLVIYSQDYDFSSSVFYTAGGTQGHNFTPPSTVPLIIAIGPAIDAAQGLPRLADYTVLARVDAPATIGGPHAPYSTLGFPNDGSQYPTQPAAPFDVTIPLSMASVPSGPFSLAVFPGYLEPGRTPWTVPSIANFEAQDFQVLLESATDFNFFDGGQNIDVTYTTPRWRYWIPGGSGNDYECIAQAAFWGIRMAP